MLKDLAKAIWYSLRSPRVQPYTLKVGYVLHTEAIYDPWVFERLRHFCIRFREITGQKPCCVVIPGNSPLIYKASSRPDEYVECLHALAAFAVLGYHGHYFLDPSAALQPENRILHSNFLTTTVERQFRDEINWFQTHGFAPPKIYSAGWWVFHPRLVELLVETGFTLDFSISSYPWLYNQFSRQLIRDHGLLPGEAARLRVPGKGEILCVQNIMGCHETPFPQDLVRSLKKHLKPELSAVRGVFHSHDYTLLTHAQNTLDCLEYLSQEPGVEFVDVEDFAKLVDTRVISLPSAHAA